MNNCKFNFIESRDFQSTGDVLRYLDEQNFIKDPKVRIFTCFILRCVSTKRRSYSSFKRFIFEVSFVIKKSVQLYNFHVYSTR